MNDKQKPGNPRKWALYRARLSCKIGRDAIDGKLDLPDGVGATEYALYNLLHAVQEIAAAMEDDGAGGRGRHGKKTGLH